MVGTHEQHGVAAQKHLGVAGHQRIAGGVGGQPRLRREAMRVCGGCRARIAVGIGAMVVD